ncbi:hypothetical protein ALCH109712_09640 [Alkalicoccus chagannorensis]
MYIVELFRQRAFFKRVHDVQVIACCQLLDHRLIKIVNDVAAAFVDVSAMVTAGAVMGIARVPHGIDDFSSRTEHAVQPLDQSLQLLSGKRHTEEHVRVTRVERRFLKGQRCLHVMTNGMHTILQTECCCFLSDSGRTAFRIVEHRDVKALRCEVARISPLSASELENVRDAGFFPCLGCTHSRRARLGPELVWLPCQCAFPALLLVAFPFLHKFSHL